MAGYIKIYRGILDWEWWSDINTYRLFTYMILKANWKDGRFKGVDIPKGSFASSVNKLAEETGLTVNEVRTALKHLINTNEITSVQYGKFTVFTISNYCLYQDGDEQTAGSSQEVSRNEQATSKSQGDNEQVTSKSQGDNEQVTRKSQGDNEEITSKSQSDNEEITSKSQGDNEQITSKSQGNHEEITSRSRGSYEQTTSKSQGNHEEITSRSRADNEQLTTIEEGNKEIIREEGNKGNSEKGKKGIKKVKEGADAPKKSGPAIYYPNDEALNRAFLDYAEMRKQIRKPLTDRAAELAMKKLKELSVLPFSESMDNDLAIRILEQSTMNCWQGLFPLKEEKQKTDSSSWEQRWREA